MWLSRKSFPSKPESNWGRGGIFTCFPHAVSECDLADFCLAAGNPARQHTSASTSVSPVTRSSAQHRASLFSALLHHSKRISLRTGSFRCPIHGFRHVGRSAYVRS
ncbi:hypothetical protein NPIL_523471 [Nephila pilipes]|uniref:Uncharacterized protein n=1 Tax=Nephila pilipes TaxID=299642 RepID=A0A8X6NMZ4_NEPPI|nr:hypothetical protein NPIL_523471 [Nephila pilipes]